MTGPSMTLTLQRVRCAVDVVVVIHYSVQPQITTSSTQQTTLAPPISLQMTATDNSTHRISQLKNFAVVAEEVLNGLPMRSRIVRQHLNVLTYPPTTPMYSPVLNTIKTHRHAECTCVCSRTLFVAHFFLSDSHLKLQSQLQITNTKVRYCGLQLLERMLRVWWR